MDSYLPLGDDSGTTVQTKYAEHVDDVGIEKDTRGFKQCGCPGTLAQEVENEGYNNIWDQSYPLDPDPRPTAGFRGGGHPPRT